VTTRTHYSDIPAFTTKDGSQIRELMHPAQHDVRGQSLAEAIVAPGQTTVMHRHHRSEELYHITQGQGRMTLGEASFPVSTGDTICIAPGTSHRIANTGVEPLRILCACTPAYSDSDTELLE
jgi:mannose-6-phosphate isomerase-like protein (cupin superfamily)